jgi:predicted transcriptional regulator
MHSPRVKILVEQYEDGFVAYPLGLDACIVGQGDTAAAAIADVRSAIRFHQTTFSDAIADDTFLVDAYVTTTAISAETAPNGQGPQVRPATAPSMPPATRQPPH